MWREINPAEEKLEKQQHGSKWKGHSRLYHMQDGDQKSWRPECVYCEENTRNHVLVKVGNMVSKNFFLSFLYLCDANKLFLAKKNLPIRTPLKSNWLPYGNFGQ